MRKKIPYNDALANIKNYLIAEGIVVDEMIMFQGGFVHEGYDHDLKLVATLLSNGREVQYYVPGYLRYTSEQPLRFLKVKAPLEERRDEVIDKILDDVV
jgi:hypothetical protein